MVTSVLQRDCSLQCKHLLQYFFIATRDSSLVLIIFEQNALNYSIPRIYLRCFNIITLGKNISHDKTHKKAS